MFENSEFGCGDGPLFAGQTGSFGIRRALMRFDVAAAVPAGSTIQSAALDVYVDKSGPVSMATDVFALHRLVSDWGEGASLCVIGDGVPAEPGDATWSYSFYDTVSWTTPGGDFSSTASVSMASLMSSSVGCGFSFKSATAAMICPPSTTTSRSQSCSASSM